MLESNHVPVKFIGDVDSCVTDHPGHLIPFATAGRYTRDVDSYQIQCVFTLTDSFAMFCAQGFKLLHSMDSLGQALKNMHAFLMDFVLSDVGHKS